MSVRLLLAPMAELSHRALRELIERFGGSGETEYFTEMISAGALISGGPFEAWYVDAGPCPERTVYQLVGGDAAVITRAAALLDRRETGGGGRRCLGIDLNMGCAAPAITRTGAGVRWMEDPDKAGALAAQVRKVVSGRLSVKLRLGPPGVKEPDRAFAALVPFCRRLEDAGVDLITLHPRLAGEKLRRTARWDYVAALRREIRIPVAGNGDIASLEDLSRRAPLCDALMLGRAAVRQPWIFAQAAGNGARPPDIEETGVLFLELLARYQPPEFHLSRARRFFGFFRANLTWGTYVVNQLNREETLAGMERVWRRCFTGQAGAPARTPA